MMALREGGSNTCMHQGERTQVHLNHSQHKLPKSELEKGK
jgi:hypothetical protein